MHGTCLQAPDHKVAGHLERATVIGSFALISFAYFYAAISRSIADYFQMDEVLAVSAARAPSLSRVWDAIWAGTDFSPPTYHFLLHGFVQVAGAADGHLVWRLPAIVAVYGAALCTYWLLVKFRLSRLSAVFGFGIVLAFGLFDYAIQVRQYALLTLGLAIALLLWSGIENTPVGKVRIGCLWLALSACLCLHFYGVVEVAAIGTAELVYWISRRRFRIAVWTALLLTVPVEAALYPLAAHLAAFNAGDNLAASYYAKPGLGGFVSALFDVVGGGGFGTLLLLFVFLAVGIAHLLEPAERRLPAAFEAVPRRQTAGLTEIEIVIVALCFLPVITFAFSAFVTGSFSTRYMVAGALLPAIAAPYMLDKLPSRWLVAPAMATFICGILILRAHAPNATADALEVLQKARPSLPIVVGDGYLYIDLMEAADASTRSNLVYLKRPAGSRSPDPTNENMIIRLATLHPEYRVSEQNVFLAGNPEFYELYRPGGFTDTTTPALIEKGLLGTVLDAERGFLLFRALSPAASHQDGGDK